jgi:hypothetical protein
MGQVKNLLIATVLGTVLLASCKKDKDLRHMAPLAGADLIDNGNGSNNKSAAVNYNISASLLDSLGIMPIVNWNSAYLNVTELHFEANRLGDTTTKPKGNGNAVTHVHYKATASQQIDLLNPALAGNVNIPFGTYRNIVFMVTFGPEDPVHALYLDGNVSYAGLTIPILLIVDESVSVKAKWMKEVTLSNNMNYLSSITANLGQLTAGIDMTMLQNLVLTNGTIVISSSSNANIYSLIKTNMQSMLKVKFG